MLAQHCAANTALNAALYAVPTTIHMIQASHWEISTSLGTCTQGPIYQGNLERILYLTPYLYKTGSDLSCAGRCVHTLGMRIWTQSDK